MSMRIAVNTVGAVLDRYRRDLLPLHPAGEAEAIIQAVFRDRLGWDPFQISVQKDRALSESELLSVYLPLKRLRTGEPLQYVLGHTEFHGLRLAVDPSVLIPRPETEELVDLIVRSRSIPPRRILDVCTGSGCIALALKKHFPGSEVTGVDASPEALVTARRNAERNQLHVEWRRVDVLDPDWMPEEVDLIVSNPPYVPRSEEAGLATHVREHEPHLALFVEDADPLLFHRIIARRAMEALAPGGELWFEGHQVHLSGAGPLLIDMGYRSVDVLKDMSGATRFIHAVR